MRIFYAAGRTPNHGVPGSRLWRENLYRPLLDLGHDVVEFDYDLEPLLRHADFDLPGNRDFVEKHRPHAERELLSQLKAAHRRAPVQLFFSYFYSACASADVIREIRDLGIVTVNWYCNASYQFHLVREIAPAYDFCLVPEKFRLDDYRRAGANPVYCQEAANPEVYRPRDVPRDLDVVFVGACYGERPRYVRRLLDAGVPVRVWGPGWGAGGGTARTARRLLADWPDVVRPASWPGLARRLRRKLARRFSEGSENGRALPPEVCGGVLSDEEMVSTYGRCKIALGFSAVGETHLSGEKIRQIRLRDFEAPMCGAFYMVEYMPELEEFFEVGKEIVCYEGPEDLAEKCGYYLTNDAERERIRLAGHRRALSDHTWQKRLATAFAQMGLS